MTFFSRVSFLYLLYCYRFPNKAVAFATGGNSTKRKSNDILHIEFFLSKWNYLDLFPFSI